MYAKLSLSEEMVEACTREREREREREQGKIKNMAKK